jgi:hypothetical protein
MYSKNLKRATDFFKTRFFATRNWRLKELLFNLTNKKRQIRLAKEKLGAEYDDALYQVECACNEDESIAKWGR